ncbi:MAG: hypothetical protein QGI42_02275 [Rhodospirillales bacterium]|jgi:dienelactone hydrolase|nr:hypothetical protein [Rhodospirillales bacterium]HJO74645.1 hypothetical protein [Rhodospirillales bacterium]
MVAKSFVCCLVAVCFAVTGCETIKPEQVADNLNVVTPEGAGPFPVVIMYEGTGGMTSREPRWAGWLKGMGIASAIVGNAGIRGRAKNPNGSMYHEDGAIAWDILKADARIDTSRFALIGFSRGGGMALKAGGHFGGKRAVPDFVFAFYPGGFGRAECSSNHADSTEVHIFFGDKDDVGLVDGLLDACYSTARWNDSVFYHELKDTTHGYDYERGSAFTCCNPVTKVRVERNEDAVAYTKSVIEKAIRARWQGR